MEKVLLTTLFTGYNYGSSLQAYASKSLIEELGYSCQLVARKSLIKGRDVRIGKLLTILFRTLMTVDSKTLRAYGSSYSKALIGDSLEKFARFEAEYLKPHRMSWSDLKHEAKQCVACVAGSDQLWNPTSLYVDPMYYLRFAPAGKRISFATSFGHDSVADCNKKKIKKWVSEIDFLSVREDSGVKLIKSICGRDASHIIDPTLLLDGNTWRTCMNIPENESKYILAYFLDSPSPQARICIENLREKYGCEVIAIPYKYEDMSYADKVVPTGPLEFLELVSNAITVVTDSFHGTAFSINLHTPFFVYNRNYGSAYSQSGRVLSLLGKLGLMERFEPSEGTQNMVGMNFGESDIILQNEREKAREYLHKSIGLCKL